MNLSVGLLYDCQKFIGLCDRETFHLADVRSAFSGRYESAPISAVLEMIHASRWIEFEEDGKLRLTGHGKKVLECIDPFDGLRIQLMDFIEFTKPTWSGTIPRGREEALKFVPDDVKQCFREARLLNGYDADVIAFWDRAANLSRGRHDDALLQIGRKGEALSVAWETARTGQKPLWKSIDSNMVGYDLLSIVAPNDRTPLKIEVKAVQRKDDQAFYLTRGEWDCATGFGQYRFHLWLLDGRQDPIVHTVDEMRIHVPRDVGNGKWKDLKISL